MPCHYFSVDVSGAINQPMNVTLNVSSALPSPDVLVVGFQLLFLGLRGQQSSLIPEFALEEVRALDLREAYEAYTMAQSNHTAWKFHEALTAAIAQLEREHTRALERASEARDKRKRHQSSFASWLSFAWEGDQERHYMEIATKVAVQLETLLHSRNELELIFGLGFSGTNSSQESGGEKSVFVSHTTQRRHLQASSPPLSEQCYCYPTSICKLTQLTNGVSGFVLNGYLSVNTGDVNGDGLDDFMISDLSEISDGMVYVVFGSHHSTWGSGVMDFTSLKDGQRGFVLQHPTRRLQSMAITDINGDGFSDLVLGSTTTPHTLGQLHIVFGSSNTSAWGDGTLSVTSLTDGQRGFGLQGEDYAFISVIPVGDINGDGCADIFLMSTFSRYVVFGSDSSGAWGNGTFLNVRSLMNGLRGFVPSMEVSFVSGGDINGDGLTDLLLEQYVIFGSRNETTWGNGALDLSVFADGQRGFVLQDSYPPSISTADINGDGVIDIVLGSIEHRAYVVFGSRLPNAWGNGTLTLASLTDGRRGFHVSDGSQQFGSNLIASAAGDVNGDGVDDFMVGAPGASATNTDTGLTYVVFGSNLSNAWGTGVLDFRNIATATRGFVLEGAPSDASGATVSSARDINGDGSPALMVMNGGVTKLYVVLSNKPTLIFEANNLCIASSETVTLSSQNLSFSYLSNNTGEHINSTSFVVHSTSLGYFSLKSSPSVTLSNFSMRDLAEKQVQFTHLGGAVAPQYRLCIPDGAGGLSIAVCSDGKVDFLGYLPTFINNQLTVSQGLSTVLQASDLSVFDPDSSEVKFLIGNLSHGNFTTTNTTSPAILEFTQHAVINGEVKFNHDGSRFKPSYTVQVNDTKSVTLAQKARITFLFEPELVFSTETIVLDEGQATTLSPLDFNATDNETFVGSIIIEVGNITAGHFAYSSSPNYNITSFQQISLISRAVQFVHDNGTLKPNFTLRAFDGVLHSPWQTPRVTLNHRPVPQQGTSSSGDQHVQVARGEDFHFSSVRFIDLDAGVNDTLTYRAQIKGVGANGGSALPPEIHFSPPNQFFGNIRSEASYIIEVLATDPRGVTGSADFILSSVDPSSTWIDLQKLYTSLSSIGGVGLTVLAYLWLRRRIAKHRRDFPFVNDLRKVLNLEYYDFSRFDGDSYKTQMFAFLQKLQPFYDQLTPQEKKSFAVCVGEVLIKRGLVSQSGYGGGLFGVCCMLNVGWPNELDLRAFEVQSDAIAKEAVNNWREAVATEGEFLLKPLSRWPYYSPTKREKLRVFCCCAKPSSADRWRRTDDANSAHAMPKAGVALTELKTREGGEEEANGYHLFPES